jgi:hypothetical protein
MLTSVQRYISSLLDILTLKVQAIIIMHAAGVALLVWPLSGQCPIIPTFCSQLHGVLLASLAGLIIRSNLSAQTLLLIGLLLNIHPRLLSYIVSDTW